jgi:hypothetical protein
VLPVREPEFGAERDRLAAQVTRQRSLLGAASDGGEEAARTEYHRGRIQHIVRAEWLPPPLAGALPAAEQERGRERDNDQVGATGRVDGDVAVRAELSAQQSLGLPGEQVREV